MDNEELLYKWLRWYRQGMGVDSGDVIPDLIIKTAKTLQFKEFITVAGDFDCDAVLKITTRRG